MTALRTGWLATGKESEVAELAWATAKLAAGTAAQLAAQQQPAVAGAAGAFCSMFNSTSSASCAEQLLGHVLEAVREKSYCHHTPAGGSLISPRWKAVLRQVCWPQAYHAFQIWQNNCPPSPAPWPPPPAWQACQSLPASALAKPHDKYDK
jgi:hypothetical protein